MILEKLLLINDLYKKKFNNEDCEGILKSINIIKNNNRYNAKQVSNHLHQEICRINYNFERDDEIAEITKNISQVYDILTQNNL